MVNKIFNNEGNMKVRDIMSKTPVYVTPDTDLHVVAKMMDEHKIGMIPVVDNKDNLRVTGVVTDRDIVTRCVAQQMNPLMMRAGEIMSNPVVTVHEDDSIEEAADMMSDNMIRRALVVDGMGRISGILAQADLARNTSDKTTGEFVEKVSKPTESSSDVNR